MTKILAGRGDGEEPAADCKPMGKRGNHRAGRYPLRSTRPGVPAGGGGGGGNSRVGDHVPRGRIPQVKTKERNSRGRVRNC